MLLSCNDNNYQMPVPSFSLTMHTYTPLSPHLYMLSANISLHIISNIRRTSFSHLFLQGDELFTYGEGQTVHLGLSVCRLWEEKDAKCRTSLNHTSLGLIILVVIFGAVCCSGVSTEIFEMESECITFT